MPAPFDPDPPVSGALQYMVVTPPPRSHPVDVGLELVFHPLKYRSVICAQLKRSDISVTLDTSRPESLRGVTDIFWKVPTIDVVLERLRSEKLTNSRFVLANIYLIDAGLVSHM